MERIEREIPNAFIWRKLQSLMGLWLVLFLIEHLLLNSQAALWIGDNGSSFIQGVNSIKVLPYLQVIEIVFLGIPFLIHGIWGIKYLYTAKFNSYPTDGSKPSLAMYPRNRAYTWQRITAWILLFGIIAHVIHMRFVEYPVSAQKGPENYYMVRLDADSGLYTLAARLGVQLYDYQTIQKKEEHLNPSAKVSPGGDTLQNMIQSIKGIFTKPKEKDGADNKPQAMIQAQERQQERQFLAALEKRPITEGQVIAVTKDFGTAELLMVRETFKMPAMMALYTIFVLAACYHGFNGLWTFLITWGITLTDASQRIMLKFSTGLMILISFLGLAAIWLTYWINLNH